jgi:2,4-dienoyl-CoA reductase-like NADH-dependent reductase (Old Yellow Enzyme family)
MKLLEPISIGNFIFRNRLVFPPLETNYATEEGAVTVRLLDHYRRIARGGVGLVVVQASNVNPTPALRVTRFVLGIYDDKLISPLQKLARVIHEEGAIAIMQLVDKSMQAKGLKPGDLQINEIHELIDYFVKASVRAQRAGFDGVDFHMAHMYTLADFLSLKANKRLDEYGRGIEGRTRIASEILQQTRQLVGRDFLIAPRFSGDEFVIEGNTLKQTRVVSEILEKSGADILDVTAGGRRDETEDKSGENSYSAHRSVPREYMPDGVNIHIMEAIRKASNIPVIAVGKIKTAELAEEILQEGKADLIAMGRQIFADPDFPRKIQEGKNEEIIPCLSCRHCHRLYFQDKPIECVQRRNKLYEGKARC